MAKHDIYNKDAEVQTNLNMFGIACLSKRRNLFLQKHWFVHMK